MEDQQDRVWHDSFFVDIMLAIVVGILSAISVSLFDGIVDVCAGGLKHILSENYTMYALMPFAGTVLMLMLYKVHLSDDHSGLGIPQVLIEIDQTNGFSMKPKRVFARVLAAMITLIFGFSAGRFGPVVHLGSAVGSNLSYRFHLSPKRIRMLVGCGASAAIASVFNAPLFGALFVLEVLYRKRFDALLAPVIIASIVGNLTGRFIGEFYENKYLFLSRTSQVPNFDGPFIINLCIMGILFGLIAIAFIRSIEISGKYFGKLKSPYSRLVIAGGFISFIAWMFPLNYEIHEGVTANIVNEGYSLKVLGIILLAKLIATGITLGSGYIGGNFYPGVTIGAASGALISQILGYSSAQSGVYSILGIGAVISGYFNAPLSGIVLTLELSGMVELVLPAALVCSISVMIVQGLLGRDIFQKPYERLKKMNA